MNTKMQFDMMAKALPYAAELMECQEIKDFKAALRGKTLGNGEIMQQLLPIFLTSHRDTVAGLLGTLNGKSAEEVLEQDWEETKKMMESPALSDLYDFFTFSARMVRNA